MMMAIVTTLMGCLPIYSHVGIWAPVLLALGRMLQSFCSAGVSTGASIFILENTPLSQRTLMSSFYDISSMSGILIASGVVTLFSMQGQMEEWWRLPFWIGGITAFFSLFLRLKTQEGIEFQPKIKKPGLIQSLKEHRGALVSITLASGFSYATYSLVFTLMNGYVPLVTSLTKSDVMQVNTFLLAIDMLLLPCFGYLAHRLGKEKVMLAGAICSALGAIPLFYFLNGAGLITVTIIRLIMVTFGVAFAAPYHAWKLERVPPEHRYTVLSLGCTLGSQLIGAPTSVLCLWLYQQLGYVWAPGLYLMLVSTLAGIDQYTHLKKTRISEDKIKLAKGLRA
jgi:MFS family permease